MDIDRRTLNVFSAICAWALSTPSQASYVLVFGDAAPRSILLADLTSLGHTVVDNVSSTLPASLAPYDTIWHVGASAAVSSTDLAKLDSFIKSGRGVHMTGERDACCAQLIQSIDTLVALTVSGGASITVGGAGDGTGPFVFNSTATGSVTTLPNALSSWNASVPGRITGVAGNTILAIGQGGAVVGAVFNSNNLIGGKGRLTVLMDSNWFSNSGRIEIIDNIQSFLAFETNAGDYNGNGVVDAADYVLWRKGGPLQNDATPGAQPGDYDVWRAHFGQTGGSGAGANANAAVPEPATLIMLTFLVAGWCLRRGRAA
jgi:hypothetical protein